MSEQKPTMKEIHSILVGAWDYFATRAEVELSETGWPEPNEEKVIADAIDDLLARLEEREKFNV